MASDRVSPKLKVFPCDKSGIPPTEQSISYEGRELSNVKATMRQLGVSDVLPNDVTPICLQDG